MEYPRIGDTYLHPTKEELFTVKEVSKFGGITMLSQKTGLDVWTDVNRIRNFRPVEVTVDNL